MKDTLALLASVSVVGFALAANAADTTTTVKFGAGAISSTQKGSITGYDAHNYVLGARGGQGMSVLFSGDNSSCYFNLLAPDGDTIFNGSLNGNAFADVLPADGNYTTQVYLFRNAARRNETCGYTITFEISG